MKNQNNATSNNVLIDSTLAALRGGKLIGDLEDLFQRGYKAVATDVAMLDIQAFLDNPFWVIDQVKAGNIVIEAWYLKGDEDERCFDGITSKPFFWSSCQQMTEAGESFLEVVKGLPNGITIALMSGIVRVLSIPRNQWNIDRPFIPVGKLPADLRERLGLSEDQDNRSAALEAAKKLGRMELFNEANKTYCYGMAKQHDCCYLLGCNGELVEM